ncbi:zincin [Thozetella sp. PMI_491]|nr:zincin [Thozetella sp. PMI_491]
MGFPEDHRPPQGPLLFNMTPSSISEETQKLISDREHLWNEIIGKITPDTATVENTLLPIVHFENHLLIRRRAIRFYLSTSPLKELRDASKEADRAFLKSDIDLWFRDDLFKLLDAIKTQQGGSISPPELDHYLTKFHWDFVVNGCALEGSSREEYRKEKQRVFDMERQFRANMDEGKAGIWLSLEELEGMPAEFVDKQKRGEGEHEGLLWVSLRVSVTDKVLKYAKREATRRKVLTADHNKLPQNVALHHDLVVTRDKLARMIGFSSHMAMKTADRMIQNPETVAKLMDQLRPNLVARGKEEIDRLLKLKEAEPATVGDVDKHSLFYWDTSYYDRIADERENSVDIKSATEYFEVWTTLKHLMAIYEHIFDIKFEEMTEERARSLLDGDVENLIWQEDVRAFLLWDMKSESFLGYMYFDLFPRSDKYSHAGHYGLQPGFTRPDGSRSYPSGAIVLNYDPPTATSPSLLTLNQTRSFFHEMGHGLHNLLSKTETALLHGVHVDKDFVETPSIMFEYFLWTARHIKGVSRHYTRASPAYEASWREANPGKDLPPEKLADDIVTALLNTKPSAKPLLALFQLHFVVYDMMVHNPASHAELEDASLAEWFNKSKNEITGLKGGEALGEGWEWSQRQSVLRLINGDNYGGAQYAYVMGRIWAIDIFESTFAKDTMSKEAGKRYRDGVLAVGGSQPARKTLTDYLGRESNLDAYYRWIGVKQDP